MIKNYLFVSASSLLVIGLLSLILNPIYNKSGRVEVNLTSLFDKISKGEKNVSTGNEQQQNRIATSRSESEPKINNRRNIQNTKSTELQSDSVGSVSPEDRDDSPATKSNDVNTITDTWVNARFLCLSGYQLTNIREYPTLSAKVITQIPCDYFGQSKNELITTDISWRKVQFNRHVGYVASNLVQITH